MSRPSSSRRLYGVLLLLSNFVSLCELCSNGSILARKEREGAGISFGPFFSHRFRVLSQQPPRHFCQIEFKSFKQRFPIHYILPATCFQIDRL